MASSAASSDVTSPPWPSSATASAVFFCRLAISVRVHLVDRHVPGPGHDVADGVGDVRGTEPFDAVEAPLDPVQYLRAVVTGQLNRRAPALTAVLALARPGV